MTKQQIETVEPGSGAEWAQALPAATVTRWGLLSTRTSYISQRGMVTAEYAVGILGAIAFALVLLNIFRSNEFVSKLTKYVAEVIGSMSKQIK